MRMNLFFDDISHFDRYYFYVLLFFCTYSTSLSLSPTLSLSLPLLPSPYRDESLRSKIPMDDEICDKLRVMVNLTDEFVAPIDGIDGLLGELNTFNLSKCMY